MMVLRSLLLEPSRTSTIVAEKVIIFFLNFLIGLLLEMSSYVDFDKTV